MNASGPHCVELGLRIERVFVDRPAVGGAPAQRLAAGSLARRASPAVIAERALFPELDFPPHAGGRQLRATCRSNRNDCLVPYVFTPSLPRFSSVAERNDCGREKHKSQRAPRVIVHEPARNDCLTCN